MHIRFSGTTFIKIDGLQNIPEDEYDSFHQSVSPPSLRSTGSDDEFLYFNTGKGKKEDDITIHNALRKYQIPSFYTPEYVSVIKIGVDRVWDDRVAFANRGEQVFNFRPNTFTRYIADNQENLEVIVPAE